MLTVRFFVSLDNLRNENAAPALHSEFAYW